MEPSQNSLQEGSASGAPADKSNASLHSADKQSQERQNAMKLELNQDSIHEDQMKDSSSHANIVNSSKELNEPSGDKSNQQKTNDGSQADKNGSMLQDTIADNSQAAM